MGKNHNLIKAQQLFATLDTIDPYKMENHVFDLRRTFEHARKNGQPDLGIRALDASGKKTNEEVEAIITGAQQDAALIRSVRHARYVLSNLQASAAKDKNYTSPSYVLEEVANTLSKGGVKTTIFDDGKTPSLEAIDALLKTQETKIAEKNKNKSQVGNSR